MTTPYTIYFAGGLFDHKELIGNAILASYIEKESGERYRCVLPQDLEQTSNRSADIRNQDLRHVMECDLAIFNFDGAELDSGTVVEFMYAKFLDIPSVILRSDFRSSGDQGKDGDDWNLMASFYPRTRQVRFNAMACYQEALRNTKSLDDAIGSLYCKIATAIIEQLDAVRGEPPVSSGSTADLERLYLWALRFPASGMSEMGIDVHQVVAEKAEKGLLNLSSGR